MKTRHSSVTETDEDGKSSEPMGRRALRMEICLVFILSLITAGAGAVTTVTGYRGGSVQIRCNYTAGYETNRKYLCRGSCPTLGRKDIPVWSGSDPEDKRFSLYDNTTDKVFIITITDLRAEDEGTYWCGIDRPVLDHYTEVELLVKTVETTTQSDRPPEDESKPPFHPSDHPESETISPSIHTSPTEHAEPRPTNTEYSGVALYSFIIAGLTLIATGVITVIYCNIKSRGEKRLPQTSRDANEDQENDRSLFSLQSRENSNISDSVTQNIRTLTPQTSQSDSVYQIMNSNTYQSCTVGQTVNPSNSRSDSVYQATPTKTEQSDSVYQIMNFQTNQSDPSYQATPTEATQSDSVYQIMRPQNNPSDSASHIQTP